ADSRVLGTGEVALRLPSALAGIVTVPVAWGIGAHVAGPSPASRRRAAIACATLVSVNPLLVWYSQEARAYGLFVLTGALAMLCFLRAAARPTARRMAVFALAGALALLTHYFAVFLLIPMALWLLWQPRTRRPALAALAAIALVGAALLPLISAQGGHGTQWIGRWPLVQRLEAIPQYYLTGYTGAALGHGIELLVALPILAALALGLWRMTDPRPAGALGAGAASASPSPASARPPAGALARGGGGERAAAPPSRERAAEQARGPQQARGLLLALAIAACGVLIPIVLVAFGADYLAPRNLVAAMIPVTAVIAGVGVWPRGRVLAPGAAAVAALVAVAVAFLAITVDVDLSPRLQRGNWRDLARALARAPSERAIGTVELGTTPLEYYLPGLHGLHARTAVRVREIDETGYAPLRASAASPPAPGFRLLARLDVDGLIAYRFVSPVPRLVSEATLRRHVIASEGTPEVLVPAGARVSATGTSVRSGNTEPVTG
ncbi:MAG TPA: glycosyltransferase family 39 protein, partial [Solirubrobacteraceae bacterium]|nr:glycosyltransferase family 39 protein [Solirubrobacteraceae bacterium]